MTVLRYVTVALAALDEILKAGGNAASLLARLRTTIAAFQSENRDPTEAEWDALNAQIAEAMAALG